MNVVSPSASEVSRSPPPGFCSDQSAKPVSNWKWPAGTVHVGVDLPGRLAQIGCSSADTAVLPHSSSAAMSWFAPRMARVCRRYSGWSSDKRVSLRGPPLFPVQRRREAMLLTAGTDDDAQRLVGPAVEHRLRHIEHVIAAPSLVRTDTLG